jgi:hypothetical protein
MDPNTIMFVETNVCDTSAWNLKWGTLILYPGGFVFNYNRPRKDAPGRMQDVVKLGDVTGLSVEKIDWLVHKIFWVGRKKVLIMTNEGGKIYYLKQTDNLFTAVKFMKPNITLTDKTKA